MEQLRAVREREGMTRIWKMFGQHRLNVVIYNKHVLLSWRVSHSDVIIVRRKKVHDDTTTCPQIKIMSRSNKRMPFGEEVAWMMLTGTHRRNKMESSHQFGVFVGVVPRTRWFVVLKSEIAVLERTIHTLPEDKRSDSKFVQSSERYIERFQIQRSRRNWRLQNSDKNMWQLSSPSDGAIVANVNETNVHS